MTGNAQVSSGTAPYNISYTLAQDVSSMTINIRKSSDKSLVATIPSSSIPLEATLAGPHTADLLNTVTWDGKQTGGATAPNGTYYAEIVTNGDPYLFMDARYPPVIQRATVDGVNKNDGRNYYGFGVMQAQDSPYKNLAFMPGLTNGNAGQMKGVYKANVDASSLGGYADAAQTVGFDWISGGTTSDGKIVLVGQSSGDIQVLNGDGSVYKVMAGANAIVSRGVRVSGTADAGNVVFVDVGSTGGGVNGISQISLAGSAVPTSTLLIPNATLGITPRTLAVQWDANNNPVAIYVTAWIPAAVVKFIPSGGTWIKDPAFNWTQPNGATATRAFVGLSPDNSKLWVSLNNDNPASGQAIIYAANPATGQPYGDGLTNTLYLDFNPESIAVSKSGNIFLTNYKGVNTGSTANAIAVVLPPDDGSTDTTRSTDFIIASDTNIRITDVQVTNLTFHGATITWTTNYDSDSTVSYGTTAGAEDKTATKAGLTKTHSVDVDGLTPNTKYYFKVKSTATGLTDGESTEASFTTPDFTISDVQVTNLSDSSARVTFKTSQPGLGIVRYARLSGGYTPGATTPDARHPGEVTALGLPAAPAPLSTDHSITLTGLSPNTQYYFVAESGLKTTDPLVIFRTQPTNAIDSAEMSFQTLSTIQVTSTSLTATTTSATLNFTTNPASAAVVKWGSAPGALTNTVNVASGTAHSAVLNGLTAGTTYYYTVELSASGAATVTTPVNNLTTAVAGGASSTITQSTAADLAGAARSQVVLGGAAGLVSLEKQGIPALPIAGTALPEGRYYGGMTASNGYIYYIGGLNPAATSTDTVFVAPVNADGSIGAWATTTTLPSGRYLIDNQTVAYGGYIYVVAGAGGTAAGNVVYYAKQNADGTLGAWLTTTPTPVDRDIASVKALDGVMYIMGGETLSEDHDNRVFQAPINADGTLGAWTLRSYMKDGLYFHRSIANAHKLYVFGGLTDANSANYAVADFNTVDIATAQPFQGLTPFLRTTDDLGHSDGAMDVLHYSMGAGLARGKIVTAAGRVSTNTYNTTISYVGLNADGSTGLWTTSGNVMPLAIKDNTAVGYNGVVYVGGGRSSAGAQAGVNYIPFDADPNNAGYVYAGNLDAKAIDLGGLSNLKHLKVTATGGGVEVRYRFAGEDAVFSPWFTASSLDADISGGARYFQYQLVLTSDGSSTPAVSSVALTYQGLAPGTFVKADVETALKIAGGFTNVSASEKTRLDIDADGSVTLKDATAINRKVNGL
jgi:hypothetical protein